MKLPSAIRRSPTRSRSHREGGSAVLIVLAFLFILELLILANTRTLDHLERELKLIDQQQRAKFPPAPAPLPGREP